MSLNWNWSDKCGTLEAVCENAKGEKVLNTFDLYQGNALLIIIAEYKENNEDVYTLYSFFADEAHAKNMMGMNKKQGYTDNIIARWGWKKIRINTRKYSKTEKLVGLLLKGLPDLTIELYAE